MARDKMTVVEHLEELRHRLMVAVAAAAAASVAGWFLAPRVLPFLLRPAQAAGAHLISLAPAELFMAYLKIAIATGLVLASPVILYQAGAFLWPALEPAERRYLLAFLPAAVLLFAGGIAFGYAMILTWLFRFFFGFTAPGVTPSLSVGNYLSFILNVLLPFGFVFQLPVLLAVLARLDLVSAEFLARNRKYAVLLIFIVAAVLTPPDPVSQLIMAAPLLVLYEISVLAVRFLTRRRRQAEAARSEP